MTKVGLDIQTKSTKQTVKQTDRVLLLGQLTKEKEIASPSHYLKFLYANRIPKAFGSTFGFARHKNQRFAKPKESFFTNSQKKIKFIASSNWHICLCPPTAPAIPGPKSEEPILPTRNNWRYSEIDSTKQHNLENFIKLKSVSWIVLTIFQYQLKLKSKNKLHFN